MTASSDSASFISHETSSDWFATDLSLYSCEFNRERYCDQLFTELAIEPPASLDKAVAKRRAEFLAGRYCARKSLGKWGVTNTAVAIGQHRNPVWPEGMIGSISHSGNRAIAITGRRAQALGVGIDLEDEIAAETVEKIQRQILSEEEITLLAQQRQSLPLLFTLAFSLKESFFKAAYPSVQQYFGFDAVSLVAVDWQARSLGLRINSDLHQHLAKDRLIECAFHLLPDKKVVTLVIINQ